MTYFEAALYVLRKTRRPLTTSELLDRIVQHGLVRPSGRTPEATLAAALYRHLGKHPELDRIALLGPLRAQRGSVRWVVKRLHEP